MEHGGITELVMQVVRQLGVIILVAKLCGELVERFLKQVALIIAGVGIAEGLIDQAVFRVSILMTIVTTMLAPMILVPAFQQGGSGLKRDPQSSSTD